MSNKYSVENVKIIVDKSTGEVVSKFTSRNDFHSRGYFDEQKGYRFRARSKKLIRLDVDIDLLEPLNNSELGRVYRLTRLIWQDTGVLAKVVNRAVLPLQRNDLYEYMGFDSSRRGREFLDKLLSLSLIRYVVVNLDDKGTTEEQWYLNPLYAATNYINRNQYLLWRDQIDKFIPDYIKDKFLSVKSENIENSKKTC
jgi:hypothetical protein